MKRLIKMTEILLAEVREEVTALNEKYKDTDFSLYSEKELQKMSAELGALIAFKNELSLNLQNLIKLQNEKDSTVQGHKPNSEGNTNTGN